MAHLRVLELNGTEVTDAGLEHLEGLIRLQTLSLFDTQITDAGLEHLEASGRLPALPLGETKVTDEGVKKPPAGIAQLRDRTIDVTGPIPQPRWFRVAPGCLDPQPR